MTNLKKPIFALCALCLLSFQQENTRRFVLVAFREPELMYGHIRQIIELRPDRKPEGDIPQLVPDDTTTFDKMGDPIQTTLGEISSKAPGYVTYSTKHDSIGRRLETAVYTDIKRVYYFDGNGRVIKREEPGPTTPISHRIYFYNSAGELSGYQEYGYHDSLRETVSFEYDLKGLLEREDYSISNHMAKADFTYLSFDEKGNWTKRIISNEHAADTVERKITYY
ncbi:MAG TPA: hypothetical protein VHS53_05955 [Mucilaginibacter sp.]|jgi:hypothetical protein|nr:hypothetical protein [Mucilaginibacter sp.]